MRLTLRGERLAELTDGDLAAVAGGQQTRSDVLPTDPLKWCVIGIVNWLTDPR